MKNLYKIGFLICSICLSQTAPAQIPVLSSDNAASSVIFLDFDGDYVQGTNWNIVGSFNCDGSGLNNQQITEIFNRVSEDYRPFNLNVTTDSTRFLAASVFSRIRVVITITSAWYGNAGGVAFVGSFNWGDDTPCFVFSSLLGFNTKNIAEAVSHESGHTLGLYHQALYDANCIKQTDYNIGQGSGQTGWAPIMGAAYYQNFTVWHSGPNSYGCAIIQNDFAVISTSLGANPIRTDEANTTLANASTMLISNNQFQATGIIEASNDYDFFKFTLTYGQHIVIHVTPFNLAVNNSGADLDIELSLFNSAGQLLRMYNPDSVLHAVIDTIVLSGTYYLRVHGSGNLNATNYGSLGLYQIQGTTSNFILPLHSLRLSGEVRTDRHLLNWTIVADEPIAEIQMQVSADGVQFPEMYNLPVTSLSFTHKPVSSAASFYRLKVVLRGGQSYYSNIIRLTAIAGWERPVLMGNLVTNECRVNSPGNFSYTVYSAAGERVGSGNIGKGISKIPVSSLSKGLYLISFRGTGDVYAEKFMKE